MINPKAFICHSSEDHQLSLRLAKDLMIKGISCWHDEWEIRPGDSIRRKIEAGIDQADYFIALITRSSLESEWVQTELDAALIRKIEGKCKLIPVLHNVRFAELSTLLSGIHCIDLTGYEEGLKKLLSVCLGLSEKPPVAEFLEEVYPQNYGLSKNAIRIAHYLNEKSELGFRLFPHMFRNDIAKELEMSIDDVADAVDELEENGWVSTQPNFNFSQGFGLKTSSSGKQITM